MHRFYVVCLEPPNINVVRVEPPNKEFNIVPLFEVFPVGLSFVLNSLEKINYLSMEEISTIKDL